MYVIHSMVIGQKTFTMPQDKVLIYICIKCQTAMIVRLKCYYPSVLKTDVLASRSISLGNFSEYGEMGRHRDNKFPKHLLL